MKELLITLITLAGLFIGMHYHDSLVGMDRRTSRRRKLPLPPNSPRP